MRDVNVNEVSEEKAQKRYTWQLALHVHVAYLALVVRRVEHKVREPFELGHVTFGHMCRPGLLKSIDGR